MADSPPDPEVTIEERLTALEGQLAQSVDERQLQLAVIMEYRRSLDAANHQIAVLKSKLSLATQPTE
ncbi:hypothetical protein [Glutamicibacter soli]